MEIQAAKRIVWPALVLFGLLAPIGLYLGARAENDIAEDAVFGTIFLGVAAVGALVALRRPDNPIGYCSFPVASSLSRLSRPRTPRSVTNETMGFRSCIGRRGCRRGPGCSRSAHC